MSTYTNLTSLSLGANGNDVVTMSSSGLSVTSVSGTAISGSSLASSGPLSTAIGAATAATNITALPSAKSFYRFSTTVSVNLKGITAGVDGQQLEIYFKAGGANTLTVTPNSTAAAAAAQIVIMSTAATIVTTASGYACFRYNSTDSKWLCKYVTT